MIFPPALWKDWKEAIRMNRAGTSRSQYIPITYSLEKGNLKFSASKYPINSMTVHSCASETLKEPSGMTRPMKRPPITGRARKPLKCRIETDAETIRNQWIVKPCIPLTQPLHLCLLACLLIHRLQYSDVFGVVHKHMKPFHSQMFLADCPCSILNWYECISPRGCCLPVLVSNQSWTHTYTASVNSSYLHSLANDQ